MYKRILVPTDGSERSVKAVEGAARFARPLGATLVVMTVVEPYSYTNLAEYRPESIEQYDERVTAEAEERLEAARKIAVAAGVEVKTVMVKSFSPAEAIIEQAEKNGCDIIFMASHGRKGHRCSASGLGNAEGAHALAFPGDGLSLTAKLWLFP